MKQTHWIVGAIAVTALACADGTPPTSSEHIVPDGPARRAMSGGVGIDIGYTWANCHSFDYDVDHDGLMDPCEVALAAAFAPSMQVQVDGDWDEAVTINGVPQPSRLGGDYGFAVQSAPDASPVIRIAYLPAYYYDQGANAPVFHFLTSDPHSGDSELILVDVAYNASSGRWENQRVFLSAHCGSDFLGFPADPNCQWINRSEFQWVDGVTWGAPIVWVSGQKHANFASQSACTHWQDLPDGCPSAQYSYRFPVVYTQQNIGSADYPNPYRGGGSPTADCQGPLWTSGRLVQLNPSAYSGAYRECWWATSGKFNGWLAPTGGGSTPYGAHLATYAGFTTGQSVYPPPPGGGSVQISGTTSVPQYSSCGYAALVSGGTAPYSYFWTVDGVGTGDTGSSMNYPNTGSDYTVGLTVSDNYGWSQSATLSVTTFPSNGMVCLNAH